MTKYDEAQNQPLEFKIIQVKSVGLIGSAWFHDDTKLGTGDELELILNRLGNEGWDVAQIIPVIGGTPPWILLRRKAR